MDRIILGSEWVIKAAHDTHYDHWLTNFNLKLILFKLFFVSFELFTKKIKK